ncbi:hypothetical protein Nepgr_011993 [Nepenthes gracilis]|uniref:Integral membrane bound transporter domain-containing protein n=1 Tax=Nepenthes gracilis TaxID=150966 RepID=A0AAD3XMG7_NEPGR|nr:hypothetical protein Nepgr_011993 [Nepenthes gracilis]
MILATLETIAAWRKQLTVALRIALAYAIVGCTTLFGPNQIQQQVTYPAFSYLTATLIVSEATLGDALRGTWEAFIGTCLVIGPAILSLWLVGPGRFNPLLAALAVGLGSFGVALPKSTPLMSKRIAFGQLVIIFVGATIKGAKTDIVMHPCHVAASMGLGALASVLATALPFPHLAIYEVRKRCKFYAKNVVERLNIYTKAIVAGESSESLELAAEAKTLSESASRLLNIIQNYQDGVLWEKLHLRLLSPKYKHPAERLQEVEVSLRGMEMALAYGSQNPKDAEDQALKDELQTMAKQLTRKIDQIMASLQFTASTTQDPRPNDDSSEKKLLPLNICATPQHLSLSFFLFCMQHLDNQEFGISELNKNSMPENHGKNEKCRLVKIFSGWLPSHQSIIFAMKCSLSLGLAALLGLAYNKDRGYWSGLAIAVSFTTSRQAAFWGANARAQGTALGSIYGVVGHFICHKFSALELVCLLPWIIFTTFLRHSKMYGETGSISAVVAALLILGRSGYGTPTEFAISRTAEACIGLVCFILMEVILQPERAATLSKDQLSRCLGTLKDYLENIMVLRTGDGKPGPCPLPPLEEQKTRLESEINELKEFIEEAKVEPNFWFTPFDGEFYSTLQKSVSRMADLSSFMASAVESLSQELQKSGDSWKDHQEQISIDIERFNARICSTLKYLEEKTYTGPKLSEEEERQSETSEDLETGKPENGNKCRIQSPDDEEMENILCSFMEHMRDVTQSNRAAENAEVRNKTLLSLGCAGFCMRSLVAETREADKLIRELIRKEKSKY